MQSDRRNNLFLKVKQWTEQGLTTGEKKPKRNVHKQQLQAKYWRRKMVASKLEKTVSECCNKLVIEKHGFACFESKTKRKIVVFLSEEWFIILSD